MIFSNFYGAQNRHVSIITAKNDGSVPEDFVQKIGG